MLSTVLVFISMLAAAQAGCDNQCSGHGTCMTDDVCKCFDNWGSGLAHDSGDCSDRICPYELAWVDTPDRDGRFHKYAECAGRGICNRETGECQCFDGYEGKGCQRTTCPNDCSGHGTCEFIDDMTRAVDWGRYSGVFTSEQTYSYHNWDSDKIRGCVCDPTYGDIDCSKKMCPHGTDVLDVRDDLLISQRYQVQELYFEGSTTDSLDGRTFALTFRSKLNETFTTIPIVYDATDLHDFVHDIQLALLNLPNRVIDGITVAANGRAVAFGASASLKSQATYGVTVNITFTGAGVQGKQNMIVVEDYECGKGCTPKIDGLNLQSREGHTFYSNATEIRIADYNSFECGRRGKCDYTTGLCQCFTGYTGCACNTLTTLY